MKRSKRESEFKIYINKGELERIREWVKEKPDIETGGDLFGLWKDASTAVVQFVLGPGKDCHRTTTSFYQGISYLENAGNCFTQQHGLCNIGQWHSHHTIPLFEPSAGDRNTVWSNMPTLGMERYVVFIANIKSSDIKVNCFLFEIKNGQKLSVKKGEIVQLPEESPLRLNNDVMEIVRAEAESLNGKDLVPRPVEENSGRKETERTKMFKPNEETHAENEMGDDKDTTVSATTSTSKGNKIANNGEKKEDNISHQNDNEDKNINNRRRLDRERTSTQTMSPKTTSEKPPSAILMSFHRSKLPSTKVKPYTTKKTHEQQAIGASSTLSDELAPLVNDREKNRKLNENMESQCYFDASIRAAKLAAVIQTTIEKARRVTMTATTRSFSNEYEIL